MISISYIFILNSFIKPPVNLQFTLYQFDCFFVNDVNYKIYNIIVIRGFFEICRR